MSRKTATNSESGFSGTFDWMGDRNMNAGMVLGKLGPEEAAEQIFRAYKDESAWLDAFTESLDRQRAGQSFARTLAVWALSQAEAARFFGVSRQAVGKWLRRGVPPECAVAISDLAAATDLLVHHLKCDRIPALEVRSEGIARAGCGLAPLRFSGAEALGARAMTRVAATRDWDAGGDSCEFASGVDGGMTA